MDIKEMQMLFRTLGQQMGLQLVRGILPESIDNYLNVAIVEIVRKAILGNTSSLFQDKVTTQHNAISQVNVVRTLLRTNDIDVKNNVNVVLPEADEKIMFYTSFGIYTDDANRKIQCRFIEVDKLYDTLNDYCNTASLDYPIISLVSQQDNKDYFELYRGYIKDNTPNECHLVYTYIKHPAKVKYSDVESERVNCDLPDHLHTEIVELAVNKYFNSVGSTSHQVS